MNIQRFTAATSREALAKARMAFGEGTLILSNRPTDTGVEVLATGEDSLAEIEPGPGSGYNGASTPNQASGKSKPTAPAKEPSYREVASQVEEDAAQLAMSTLSFQDYVRERMAKKRQATLPEPPRLIHIAPDPLARPSAPPEIRTPAPAPRKTAATSAPEAGIPLSIERELHAMKAMMEDRFNTLHWLGQARQNPIQANLMLKLIRAGYSPSLSRSIMERMPETLDAQHSTQWVMDVLERNLRTDAGGPELHEEGGVFALIGATGVGKTTTAAKLAGLCARRHGPSSVGLITLDTYRVGAQEQLRAYGKMLGVVAHLAHDRAALQDLLGLLAGKKMVLIDTTGLAPRDPRKREMLELLEIPEVKRLLVLNAGGHGDTLEDTVGQFKSPKGQQVIFSKIDEAVKLGPAMDAAIRHQLVLRGVTTGQRVPEDWEAASANKLVRASLRSSGNSAFDPKITDLGFLFSQPSEGAHSFTPVGGALHA
ncbi:flagellar biosynthesis protein FlhF [Rhodoferax sp.]|jgi:flagellar biosynthesis protein FlhF|uniref:flagellar biosynthesis protein FlhF n=1 Tax=Rhodoferax sp. TaxID=50421 RepID=UPI0037851410